jgi:HSP20 family molecular chaperone IbpA
MSDEKKKGRKAIETIDLNLGGLLGQLGEALGEAVQKLGEAAEQAQDIDTSKGPIRAQSSLQVRVGGIAKAAASARPKATPPAPTAPKPLDCELIEDGEAWILTADLPGVLPEVVTLDVEGQPLSITTQGARRYVGSVDLARPIEVDAISMSLVDGILTLRASP